MNVDGIFVYYICESDIYSNYRHLRIDFEFLEFVLLSISIYLN